MFRRAFAILPVLFALAACKTAPVDEPIVKTTEAPARPGEIGAACEPGGSVKGLDPCGTKQRIAVRVVTHHRGTPAMVVPCALSNPTQPKEANMGMGSSAVSTCIAEGTLYANMDCVTCRIPGAGQNVVAKLDELTTAQALAVQTRLNLPADKPLHGEKEWREALAARNTQPSS